MREEDKEGARRDGLRVKYEGRFVPYNIVVTMVKIRDQSQKYDSSYSGTVENQSLLFYIQNTRRKNENM
jgi:hypothetical protein